MQGYGYDHLILKLEWAKPSSDSRGGGGGGGGGRGEGGSGGAGAGLESSQFRSGYGKALAQDTKQRVHMTH